MAAPALLVACLCAAWCRTCEAYRPLFDAVARAHAGHRFVYVDIEDEADRLPAELDVDDFPTLLIAEGDTLRFLGPLTPEAATLQRLLAAAEAGALPPAAPGLSAAAAGALLQAVRALR
ncbi:thioredoxin family protein [Aquabacterium sp. J223]|uniref:thioredoxin family protein n=1 Tax=Aquabacterium sp. J223 TaxID=2898431 RepID=UPI0021AE2990|nr:thioredoxin family protein [Aquabacterium sp. J223]UUX96036.1 thioredoxin family protein [Aquabacterium sp. J223]